MIHDPLAGLRPSIRPGASSVSMGMTHVKLAGVCDPGSVHPAPLALVPAVGECASVVTTSIEQLFSLTIGEAINCVAGVGRAVREPMRDMIGLIRGRSCWQLGN